MQSAIKAIPETFTSEQQQELFEETLRLYSLTDAMLASLNSIHATHQAKQFTLVKPFVTQVTNSANILSAFYTEVVRSARPITPELQNTLEMAFQNIFSAYSDLLEGIKHLFLPQEH